MHYLVALLRHLRAYGDVWQLHHSVALVRDGRVGLPLAVVGHDYPKLCCKEDQAEDDNSNVGRPEAAPVGLEAHDKITEG